MKQIIYALLGLLLIDAVVLAIVWVPPLFGYVGSENYEWMSLKIGVVGMAIVPVLLVLLGILAFVDGMRK